MNSSNREAQYNNLAHSKVHVTTVVWQALFTLKTRMHSSRLYDAYRLLVDVSHSIPRNLRGDLPTPNAAPPGGRPPTLDADPVPTGDPHPGCRPHPLVM